MPFVVPAVLATGVWGYTAAGLIDEQLQLRTESDRASSVAGPAQELVTRLQEERRHTSVWQGDRTGAAREELDAARGATDDAVAAYRGAASTALGTAALSGGGERLGQALDELAERREAVDDRSLNSADTFQFFTGAVAGGTDLIAAALRSEDAALAGTGAATTALVRLTEMLAREDALISGALPAEEMSDTTRSRFLQYLAVQQELRASLTSRDLPAGGAAGYGEITGSRQWTSIGVIENAVQDAGGTGLPLPRQASSWPDAADSVVGGLQSLGADSVRGVSDEASDRAGDLLLGLLLGTAATLAALVGGALLALRGRRRALDRICELQKRTEELSGVRLPQLMSRIERGERVEPQPLAPEQQTADDELARLGAAITHLGNVAADTAVRQNLGREGTEKVFSQLIRRTQILIHRLISLLDDLERKHEDSDLLKDIFKVDHLATRVRRHAENLVILSGSPPSRRMTAPVSITDVMRSAVAETESYTRVKVKNLPADLRLALTGRAVADVTHLLAELIENGTSFSPPDTQVFISATRVAKGLAVHVEDHGLGMPEDLREKANHLLAHPPKVDMTALGEDPRLGHFVVARLAERYKIKVELRESVYGGTLVVVLLPADLLEDIESPVLDQLQSAAAAQNRAVRESGERTGIPADGRTGAPAAAAASAVSGTALAGPAVGAVPGGAGTVSAGTAAHSGTNAGSGATARTPAPEVLTHSRTPDHSGFPDYGGAGLLPPAPEHTPGSRNVSAAAWAAPQEHPAHRAESGARDGRTSAPAAAPGTSAARPAQEATGPLSTPTVLPQRTRGASLAQQLRKEADHQNDSPDRANGLSPDASARTMLAIQQGLKRARFSEDGGPDGTDDRKAPRDPGAH
ncbi:nitrate- and nitrite sensing domain-containing protein [Streptomyces sp. CRN 30]|uniref:sensor histidine kinase n=1 Tax=Streptomyces sp. CRN 30 TaxID=3075613 RepID=UPI002A7FF774|nr:nitrate- and nitrite sensing domain-containing protein [Streptomyces sp. CRN 30]